MTRARPLDGLIVAGGTSWQPGTEPKRDEFARVVADALLTGGRRERHLGYAELVRLVAAATARWDALRVAKPNRVR